MKKKYLTTIILLVLINIVFPQTSHWKTYTTSNSGLPNNFITALAIDRNGIKWIGTRNGGLSKFDDINWTTYNTSNSGLPHNDITSVAIDTNNDIWIVTGVGIVKFDGTSWTRYTPSNSGLPGSGQVYAVAIDENGNKWIGTDGGLAKFDGTNWEIFKTSNSGLPYDCIMSITIDKNENKWIGTSRVNVWEGGGLTKYDGFTWITYDTSNSNIISNWISSVATDKNGVLWIGHCNNWVNDKVLSRFDGMNWTTWNYFVTTIEVDEYNNIWFGTSNTMKFLMKFDGTNWTTYTSTNSGLPGDVISFALDEKGNKWIGSSGYGLTVFTEPTVITKNPNGGEVWKAGSQQNIIWASSNVTNVKIEYTTDNGTNWSNIISNISASTGMYSWAVPNTPSTQCLVRISDASDATISDIGDNTFTIYIPEINQVGNFEEDIPSYWMKGAEPVGSALEWATDQYRSMNKSLKITKQATAEAAVWESDYMQDLWSPLHYKNIDMLIGAYVKTEGVNTNPANDDQRWYISYSFYNQSGNLIRETILPINQSVSTSSGWTADTNGVGQTILQEDSWKTIIKFVGGKDATGTVWADDFILIGRNDAWAGQDWNTSVEMPTGWNYWLPPNGGNDGKFDSGFENTVITTEQAYTGLHSLKFDLPFNRAKHDAWVGTKRYPINADAGDVYRISVWIKASNLVPDSAAVDLTMWSVGLTPIFHSGYLPNDTYDEIGAQDMVFQFPAVTSFDWTKYYADVTVPDNPNVKSLSVRIHIYAKFTGTIYFDKLEVEKMDIPEITLMSPNGGEGWQSGSAQNITWTSTNVDNVKLEYTTDNGTNWTTVIASTPASTGSYSWTIPNTPSTTCKVRISDASNSAINDISDVSFSIIPGVNITFQVDMSTQVVKGIFNATKDTVYLRGTFTNWVTSDRMLKQQNNIYTLTKNLNVNTNYEYKYFITSSGAINGGWEGTVGTGGDGNRVSQTENTDYTIPVVYFNNEVSAISIISPNGGESWLVGSFHNITWILNGVTNFKIEYTTNNGTNWLQVIASTTANNGSFTWTVPNTPSANCKVRISDASNSSISDISDNPFSIIKPSISLISPNGGERWQAKSVQPITWTSSNVNYVKIEYSTNNGTNWITRVTSIQASVGVYNFLLPDISSSNCKVRISDAGDATINDLSDNTFSIYMSTIDLTTPLGTEYWQAQSTHNITWNSTNIANLKLEYTTNNGTDWTIIIASTPANVGTYAWKIPYVSSVNCLVRISDANNPLIYDVSDNFFTIYMLTLTSPNGGENWIIGSTYNISWTSTNISNVSIAYSTNLGVSWITVTNLTPASNGSYSWIIPNTPSAYCKIGIKDANNPSIVDYSDNVFTISKAIVASITVTEPNGGENWEVGSTHNITWISTLVTSAKIIYTIDNGINWSIITDSIPASAGSYSWIIPNTPSTNCKVGISDVSNATVYDLSNYTFTISAAVNPTIIVTSPNGGEIWLSGTQHNITWTSTNVTNVKFEYTTNNGSTWTTILASTPANTGSYPWTVPDVPSTQCKIRVSDAADATLNDLSNAVFTIINQYITVISPNGSNHVWAIGSTQTITWTSQNVENVKIEYSTNDGSTWITIISSTSASPGSYSWTIPNTPSTQCRVRISDITDAAITDVSDNAFTIFDSSTSTAVLLTPNGGESWQAGSYHNITWVTNKITNVKLEYSTNNGTSWLQIIESVPNLPNNYTWNIPNTPSEQCIVRISDASNPLINDVSNNTFTISEVLTPGIVITAPNGGENWEVGSQQNITWASNNVVNVKIDYTTDSGTNWIEIIASTPAASGSYSWTIPNIPSTNCKVRLSDAANLSTKDESENLFSIFKPSITVTVPNGGEQWQAGTQQSINWMNNNVDSVKIEFTSDSGANWMEIIQSTETGTGGGGCSWLVPNTPSSNCKVRISDVDNALINDISDNDFTIIPQSTITVLSPNGGESRQAGTTENITWVCQGVANVKLEYTADNDTNWITINESVSANSGAYSWVVPNTPSDNCRVRISNTDNSAINDVSNNVFTIVALVTNNRSVYFNGVKGLLYVTDDAPANPDADKSGYIITGNKITVEAWVYPISLPELNHEFPIVRRPYLERNPWCSYTLFLPNPEQIDNPIFTFIVTNGDSLTPQAGVQFNNPLSKTWTHLAGTYDGETVRLYVNGNLVGENPYTQNLGTGDTGFIIGGYPGGGNTFHGMIDEVRLWNVARTQQQIKSYLNNALIGNEEGLVGYWPLDSTYTGSNSLITPDKSKNHNDLYVYNAAFIDASAQGGAINISSPSVATESVSNYDFFDATLVGYVNPNGISTNVFFEYGETTNYDNKIDAFGSPFGGNGVITVNADIDSLEPGKTYHYRVVATNTLNETQVGDDKTFTTKTYPTSISVSQIFSFGDVLKTESYKMIGLPGNNNLPMTSVIDGEFNKDWIAYMDDGSGGNNYLIKYDGSDQFNFTPGNAFWVLSKNQVNINTLVTTVPLNASYCLIPLNQNGWTQISNPFEINVSWNLIKNLNSITQPIHYFENGSYSEADLFEPYKGYYFANTSNLSSLKIPYKKVSNLNLLKKELASESDSVEISFKLTLYNIQGLKKEIAISFNSNSSDSLDKYDIVAPPGDFETTRLAVYNESIPNYKYFIRDSRKEIGTGQEYRVELKNKSENNIKLFAETGKALKNFEIFLIDESTFKFYNLKEVGSLVVNSFYKAKCYKLLIGNKEYIETKKKSLTPKEFVLYQNFPNPFNPVTQINFSLPEKAFITLKVFNILGKEVSTLVNEEKSAGFYEVAFDGSSIGGGLSTGVYFYRLQAEKFVDTKKFILLK